MHIKFVPYVIPKMFRTHIFSLLIEALFFRNVGFYFIASKAALYVTKYVGCMFGRSARSFKVSSNAFERVGSTLHIEYHV